MFLAVEILADVPQTGSCKSVPFSSLPGLLSWTPWPQHSHAFFVFCPGPYFLPPDFFPLLFISWISLPMQSAPGSRKVPSCSRPWRWKRRWIIVAGTPALGPYWDSSIKGHIKGNRGLHWFSLGQAFHKDAFVGGWLWSVTLSREVERGVFFSFKCNQSVPDPASLGTNWRAPMGPFPGGGFPIQFIDLKWEIE